MMHAGDRFIPRRKDPDWNTLWTRQLPNFEPHKRASSSGVIALDVNEERMLDAPAICSARPVCTCGSDSLAVAIGRDVYRWGCDIDTSVVYTDEREVQSVAGSTNHTKLAITSFQALPTIVMDGLTEQNVLSLPSQSPVIEWSPHSANLIATTQVGTDDAKVFDIRQQRPATILPECRDVDQLLWHPAFPMVSAVDATGHIKSFHLNSSSKPTWTHHSGRPTEEHTPPTAAYVPGKSDGEWTLLLAHGKQLHLYSEPQRSPTKTIPVDKAIQSIVTTPTTGYTFAVDAAQRLHCFAGGNCMERLPSAPLNVQSAIQMLVHRESVVTVDLEDESIKFFKIRHIHQRSSRTEDKGPFYNGLLLR